MATSTVISCGSLIYCKQTDRYLFLLRAEGRYKNFWGIVGGKVDSKETVIDALKREIREELGGEIKDAKYFHIDTYFSKNKEFSYYTFLTTVDEEFIPYLNKEHKGFCWVELEDLPNPKHPGLSMTINSEIKRNNLLILQKN